MDLIPEERTMSLHVIEGMWEEVKRREAELAGRFVRVTIKPEPRTTKQGAPHQKPAADTSPRVSAYGKYAGILSSEDFIRAKQEEIDLEDRAR
jgi:hypothetical protein